MPRRRPEWGRRPQAYPAVKGHPSAKLGVYRLVDANSDPQLPMTMHLTWEVDPTGPAMCGASGPWVNHANGRDKLICVPCADRAGELRDEPA